VGNQVFSPYKQTAKIVVKLFLPFFLFLICMWGGESKLGPLGTSATEWPIVPAPGDYDDGQIGGMKIGRGN
jgi:hypothetical protein